MSTSFTFNGEDNFTKSFDHQGCFGEGKIWFIKWGTKRNIYSITYHLYKTNFTNDWNESDFKLMHKRLRTMIKMLRQFPKFKEALSTVNMRKFYKTGDITLSVDLSWDIILTIFQVIREPIRYRAHLDVMDMFRPHLNLFDSWIVSRYIIKPGSGVFRWCFIDSSHTTTSGNYLKKKHINYFKKGKFEDTLVPMKESLHENVFKNLFGVKPSMRREDDQYLSTALGYQYWRSVSKTDIFSIALKYKEYMK